MRLYFLCFGFTCLFSQSASAFSGTITGNAADGQANSDGTVTNTTATYGRVGGDSGVRHSVIHVFQIPPSMLIDPSLQFATATYSSKIGLGSSMTVNIDLYGLGYSTSPTISAVDFYEGPFDANSVLLKDNFITPTTATYSTVSESGAALVNHLNACLSAARTAGVTVAYVFIRESLDAYVWSNVYVIGMNEAGGAYIPTIAYTTTSAPVSQNETVNGNLAVTGSLSAAGNTSTFGTQGAVPGLSLNYTPGSIAAIDFSASSSAANWYWHQGANAQLRLSDLNVLTLYSPATGAAGIVLNPVGYSGFGTATPTAKLDVVGDVKVSGKVRVSESGDLSMGLFKAGTSPAQ